MTGTPAEKPSYFGDDGSPSKYGWRWIHDELVKPMPYKTYSPRPNKQFAYIDPRQVMDRLDEIVGPGNWSDAYRVFPSGAVECTLTIFGVSKSDVGYQNNPEAEEGDRQFEHEPLKAAYSDAIKRAAVKWGIGRFLYSLKP